MKKLKKELFGESTWEEEADPPIQNFDTRIDRQQIAVDIAKIAEMLILISIKQSLLEEDTSKKPLFYYSQQIRNYTAQLTEEELGKEQAYHQPALDDDGGIIGYEDEVYRYYPKISTYYSDYVKTACRIVAKFIDGITNSRFLTKEKLEILRKNLDLINGFVEEYNQLANLGESFDEETILLR